MKAGRVDVRGLAKQRKGWQGSQGRKRQTNRQGFQSSHPSVGLGKEISEAQNFYERNYDNHKVYYLFKACKHKTSKLILL